MSYWNSEEQTFPLVAAPGNQPSTAGSPGERSFEQRLLALLDQIRAMDTSMNEARLAKIENIKKALEAGTYNVSPAEVAQKIIDQMDEF